MTAKVLTFPGNKAARLLRDFSRQTDDVGDNLDSMQESLSAVSTSLKETCDTLAQTSEEIRHTVEDFDEHRAFYRECLDAMDSGSIEKLRRMALQAKRRLYRTF